MNGRTMAYGVIASVCVMMLIVSTSADAQKRSASGVKPRAAARCTVSGKVTDLTTGKPVAGLPVMVYVQHAGSRSANRVVTDRNGVYKTSVPRGAQAVCYVMPYDPEGKAAYLLDDAWMQSWRPRTLTVSKDTTHDIRLKLLEARDVVLTATLPDGKPASGVQVLAGRASAQTGQDGRATLKVPKKAAALDVAAISSDHKQGACAVLKPDQRTLALRMEPLRTIRGRVTDREGKPLPNVRLVAMPIIGEEAAYRLMEPMETRTDAEGRFEVKGLPVGRWMVYWNKGEGVKAGQMTVALKGADLEPVTAERAVVDPSLFKGSIGRSPETKITQASSFALDGDDNILVCDEARSKVVKVSPDDKLLATWTIPFQPEALDVRTDGCVLVGGHGKIALLDASGNVKATGNVPGGRSVTAIAHEGSDVFVCAQGETGFAVYRMKDDFTAPKRIIGALSGCCGQMDIRVHKGFLYAAENTRFSVGKYSLDGKKVADFVHSDSKKPAYYGEGCCEPKNLCFGPDGTIYTGASGKMEVKRYGLDGKFLGDVGHLPDSDGSCVRVTLGVSKDGKRVYILDTGNNVVRLVPRK